MSINASDNPPLKFCVPCNAFYMHNPYGNLSNCPVCAHGMSTPDRHAINSFRSILIQSQVTGATRKEDSDTPAQQANP